MKYGIDVSAWQGKINWDLVKSSNRGEFAMLRMGYGTKSMDAQYKRNAQECERLNIPIGGYWFIYAANDTEAQQNAIACLNAAKGHKFDYPICADLEYDSITYAAKRGVVVTKEIASRWVKIFLDTIKKAGYSVANYTNLDYYKRMFTTEINNRYDVWFAYWGSATQLSNASALWQYSSKGSVAGIVGNVDVNEAHKAYPESNPNPNIPDVPVTPDDKAHKIPAIYDCVFDPKWYFSHYTDLQDAVAEQIEHGNIPNTEEAIAWWLFQHFALIGMDEADNGRFGNESFNVIKYKAAYKDLRDAFGDKSYKPYYEHYMLKGKDEISEGKRADFK